MAGKPPPPSTKAPVSRETVEVVRKKIAAPSGPPPAGMLVNFSAPKSVASDRSAQYKRGSSRRYDNDNNEDDDDEEDENQDHDDYRDNSRRSSSTRPAFDQRVSSRDKDRGRDSDRGDALDADDHRKNGYAHSRRDGRRSSVEEEEGEEGRRYYEDEQELDDRDAEDELEGDEDYEKNRSRGPGKHSIQEDEGDNRRLKPTYDENPSPLKSDPDPLPEARYANSKESGSIPIATAAPVLTSKDVHGATFVPTNSMSKSSSKLAIYSFQRLLSSTYRELKNFVMSPAPPGYIVRCYIERSRSGSKLLAPCYSLCADLEDGTGRELMVCRKIMKSRTSHYVFSLKAEDLYRKREQRSRLYLGKLRAVSNNDYVLYDNGICAAPDDPDSLLEALESSDNDEGSVRQSRNNAVSKKMERDMKEQYEKTGSAGDDVSLYRKELAVVHFNTKSRPAPAGIRGMEVCIPIDPSGAVAVAESKSTISSSTASAGNPCNIVKPFERIRLAQKQNVLFQKTCFILHEKASRYDPLSSCLVDFRGRAHMASVKNFQLVVSDPMSNYPANPSAAQEMLHQHDAEADFLLQLGKTTEDCFNMDFRGPLSLLQCFAICIARFDAKLQW